jgi:hypothetical protein
VAANDKIWITVFGTNSDSDLSDPDSESSESDEEGPADGDEKGQEEIIIHQLADGMPTCLPLSKLF